MRATKAGELLCPLCLDDDTVDLEAKTKNWGITKLARHIHGTVHSGFDRFKRQANIDADEHPNKRFVCPYCEVVAPTEVELTQYPDFHRLARHVKQSTSEKINQVGAWTKKSHISKAHDALKEEAGWYEPDWEGAVEMKYQRARTQRRYLSRLSGFKWSDKKELTGPIPHPTIPGVVYGDFSSDEIEDRLKPFITTADTSSNAPIPDDLKPFI